MDIENNEELQGKALEQLKMGKSPYGKDGAFAFLVKKTMNGTLIFTRLVYTD